MRELTAIEVRILGSLMEKARTVPDTYPLTLNSLLSACNQKTSREPLLQIDSADAAAALAELSKLALVFEAPASRVTRYAHNVQRGLALDEPAAVVLGLLMLRGPQTPAELRLNAERWYKFVDAAAVESVLQALQQRGDDGGAAYVTLLPRAPGAREARWMHLLCGQPEISLNEAPSRAAGAAGESLQARMTQLEQQVQLQTQTILYLQQQLADVCQQLGIVAVAPRFDTPNQE